MGERLRITNQNYQLRLDDALHTILSCWSDWEAYARQESQQSQDPEAGEEALRAQLSIVLEGMLFDECKICNGTHVVDSGGVWPSGKSIDLPCPECFPDTTT